MSNKLFFSPFLLSIFFFKGTILRSEEKAVARATGVLGRTLRLTSHAGSERANRSACVRAREVAHVRDGSSRAELIRGIHPHGGGGKEASRPPRAASGSTTGRRRRTARASTHGPGRVVDTLSEGGLMRIYIFLEHFQRPPPSPAKAEFFFWHR